MLRRLCATIAWCSLAGAPPASAQRFDLDGSLGYGDRAWRAAVASQWRLPLGSRLTLGSGVRFSYYAGESSQFRNPGATTPSLTVELPIEPSVWGINLMVSAQGRLVGSLAGGANIDLGGVAAGPVRQAGGVELRPARGSVLLLGERDRGSLNSEFFLALPLGACLELRGGLSHYVVGYHARDGTTSTRYLRFETVPFVAARWRLGAAAGVPLSAKDTGS